jgi:hypothetical protein
MNTGHEGGCGTVHANSTADIPARLEALGVVGGLPRPVLHAQLAAALDAVIHVARDDSGYVGSPRFRSSYAPRSGASAASMLSISALTAAACWGRVAGSWNGSNVDHDHDESVLCWLRCWRYAVQRREVFAADSFQRLRLLGMQQVATTCHCGGHGRSSHS